MRVRVTSAAEADLTTALDWYDIQAPGIGARFLDEYELILSRLGDNSRSFTAIPAGLVFVVFPMAYFSASARPR